MIPKEKAKEYSYDYIHKWIRNTYGNANKCENEKCSKKSNIYEYAMINSSLLQKDRKNFKMLCRSCHRNYDKNFGNIGDLVRGKPAHNKNKNSRIDKICENCGKNYKHYKLTSVTCSKSCAGYYREKQKKYGR
jgi:hypothetical protein